MNLHPDKNDLKSTRQRRHGLLYVAPLVILILISACTSTQKDSALSSDHALILISLDGFRADFIDRYPTPNLDRLIERGVTAEQGMIPSFPTLTFPNHFSMVTGLYPSNHGIISNTMYDEPTDSWFRISDREAVENSMWWEGEPIWVTASEQGKTTATYFWVGSEAPIHGVQPTYWKRFDGSVPGEVRVEQVLEWLKFSGNERPEFIALYFEDVDSAVHRHGIDSEEAAEAVARVDSYLGLLLDGLARQGISDVTDIIVVSDHGMSDRKPERSIVLEDYIDLSNIEAINTSPVAMLNTRDGNPTAVVKQLQGVHPELKVYLREDVPDNLHFTGHHRIPEIIAIAGDGWTIFRDRAYFEKNRSNVRGATHGYHPDLLSMRALFVASGPSFKSGRQIEPFENVHLYPLMAHILGLDPADTDGSLSELQSTLRVD